MYIGSSNFFEFMFSGTCILCHTCNNSITYMYLNSEKIQNFICQSESTIVIRLPKKKPVILPIRM